MNRNIQGSVALVTGANRGIGRALVESLLARGAARIYAGTRQPHQLQDLVRSSSGRIIPLRLDVRSSKDVRVAAATATDTSILINNAGVAAHFGGDFTDERWLAAGREEFEVNVLGLLAVTQAFAPVLARNGGGAIVNLSSVAGLVAFPAFASYSVTKAAVHSLTQTMRAMLRANGTFVAAVYPGPIDTEMTRPVNRDKASPASAAEAILDGLEAGEEDIFPDPVSRQIGTRFLADPKGLERDMRDAAA